MNEYDRELLKLRLRRILSSRTSAIALATLGTFTTVALAIQGSSPPTPAPATGSTSGEGELASNDKPPSILDVPAKYRDKLLALPSPSPLPNLLAPRSRSDKGLGSNNETIAFTPRPLFPPTEFGRNSRTPTTANRDRQYQLNATSKRDAKFRVPSSTATQPLPTPLPSTSPSPLPEVPFSFIDAITFALASNPESARTYLASRKSAQNDSPSAATTLKVGENLLLTLPLATGSTFQGGAFPDERETNPPFRSLSQQIIGQLSQSLPQDSLRNLAVLQAARLTEESDRLAARQMLEERVAEAGTIYRSLLQAQARVAIEAAALDRARRQSLQPSEARWQEAKAALDLVRTELSARFQLGALPVATVVPSAIEPFALDESALQQFMLANRPDYLQSQLEVELAKVALQQAENLSVAANKQQAEEKGRSASKTDVESYRQALLGAEHSREVLAKRLQLELGDRIRELDLSFKQLQLARETRASAESASPSELRGRELERWHGELVSAQQDELNATIACFNAIARLDLAIGNTLNRWGIEVNTR